MRRRYSRRRTARNFRTDCWPPLSAAARTRSYTRLVRSAPRPVGRPFHYPRHRRFVRCCCKATSFGQDPSRAPARATRARCRSCRCRCRYCCYRCRWACNYCQYNRWGVGHLRNLAECQFVRWDMTLQVHWYSIDRCYKWLFDLKNYTCRYNHSDFATLLLVLSLNMYK